MVGATALYMRTHSTRQPSPFPFVLTTTLGEGGVVLCGVVWRGACVAVSDVDLRLCCGAIVADSTFHGRWSGLEA